MTISPLSNFGAKSACSIAFAARAAKRQGGEGVDADLGSGTNQDLVERGSFWQHRHGAAVLCLHFSLSHPLGRK
jgi:hypothetical protein